jgi:hypothetical protein
MNKKTLFLYTLKTKHTKSQKKKLRMVQALKKKNERGKIGYVHKNTFKEM